MSRLTSGMDTESAAATGSFAYLISLAFSGGTEYLTTASSDVTWSGDTYAAVGGHLSFDAIHEVATARPQGVRMTFDGVDQTIISALLGNNYIGRAAKIYLVHFDSSGAIVADPELLFDGLINGQWDIETTGDTVKVSTRVLPPTARFRQRNGIRTSLQSHQAVYANDTIMRHLTALNGKVIVWGRHVQRVGGNTGIGDPSDPGTGDGDDTPLTEG